MKLKRLVITNYTAGIDLFKVNNGNTRTMCEICSTKSGAFIISFEHILHLFLALLLLTLNK